MGRLRAKAAARKARLLAENQKSEGATTIQGTSELQPAAQPEVSGADREEGEMENVTVAGTKRSRADLEAGSTGEDV